MAFDNVGIQSTRNGVSLVTGFRQDLAQGDIIVLSLTDTSAVLSFEWQIIGRPEFSSAGGGGPNPWSLGSSSTASFTVDADSGSVHVDGTYIVQCTINKGSPNETRKTAALARVSGKTITGPVGNLPLRKLGGFEALEDTSVSQLLAGWATQMNRWLEFAVNTSANGGFGYFSPVLVPGATDNTTSAPYQGTMLGEVNFVGGARPFGSIPAANLTANRLYATPFIVGSPRKLQTLLQKISGSVPYGATETIRAGIYADATSKIYPGAKLFDSGPQRDTQTTFVFKIADTINLTLTSGLYWLVIQPSAAYIAAGRGWDNPISISSMLPLTSGYIDPTSGQVKNPIATWFHDMGSFTLPDPFPSSAPTQVLINGENNPFFSVWPSAVAIWG